MQLAVYSLIISNDNVNNFPPRVYVRQKSRSKLKTIHVAYFVLIGRVVWLTLL